MLTQKRRTRSNDICSLVTLCVFGLCVSAGSVVAEFESCVASADEYQLAVFYSDLSSNFRDETKEQRKFLREKYQIGGAKRARDAEEETAHGMPAGVKQAIAIVIQFTRRRAARGAAVTGAAAADSFAPVVVDESGASSSSSLAPPRTLLDFSSMTHVEDQIKQLYISPFGSDDMETVGTFMLPMSAPRLLVPDAHTSEERLQQVEHAWRLRVLFLNLVCQPPSHLHALMFDSKSVLCALLAHFHVAALDIDFLSQMSDPYIAAWLVDPDDTKKTGLHLAHLMTAYCNPYLTKHRMERKKLGEPGDNDIVLFMHDMADVRPLMHQLFQQMHQEHLLRPYVHQELCLLPVVIDMQLRGVNGNFDRFAEAEGKLQAKIFAVVRKHTSTP